MKSSLVGWHFLSREGPGAPIKWQGRVVAATTSPGVYLLQLYSWLDGGETHAELTHTDVMAGWEFYPTGRAMREAADAKD